MATTGVQANNVAIKYRGRPEREMPVQPGTSPETVSSNITELHTGKTYARTKRKFGKKKANKQAIAIAMSEKRKSARHLRKRGMISAKAAKQYLGGEQDE